jgi:alpha-ribazole phosphatase/probable phosphoglycerate mutase
MTVVVLCRHGEPEEAGRGRFCGALDVGLSERGRAHAVALAACVEADVVYTSPLRRCVETARALAARLGVEPVVEPRLREIEFGELDGVAYEDAERRWPALYTELLRSPATVRFPGGESYGELRIRVCEALDELLDRHGGGSVAVLTHAGVIRTLLAHVLSLPDEAFFRIDQRYGAVNVVEWAGGAPVVRLVNAPPASLAPDA